MLTKRHIRLLVELLQRLDLDEDRELLTIHGPGFYGINRLSFRTICEQLKATGSEKGRTVIPFDLVRDADETGVSGTGVVAEGVIFHDGTVALRWKTAKRSTAIYDSIQDVEAIHGHDGKTRVVYLAT